MFDYIDKLRAKKPHEKQMIAFGVAATITIVIGLFWLATLPYEFSQVQNQPVDSDSVSQFQNVESGFSDMWAKASGSYQALKSNIQQGLSNAK